MGANNKAPSMYANGAAGPSEAYRVPGNAKMLPPMVMLTMDAARPQKPTARASGEEFVSAPTGVRHPMSSQTCREPDVPGLQAVLPAIPQQPRRHAAAHARHRPARPAH